MSEFRKFDTGKAKISYLCPRALKETAEISTSGAEKYDPYNWCKDPDWNRYYDAVQRHLMAWQAGEDKDPESGKSHLAHAACTINFLQSCIINGLGVDDRICNHWPWYKENVDNMSAVEVVNQVPCLKEAAANHVVNELTKEAQANGEYDEPLSIAPEEYKIVHKDRGYVLEMQKEKNNG